jgi:Uma2 family endonuclease
MATLSSTYITPEEYLARERAAETKSEYYQGKMFAMAGASREHGLIVTNLVRELSNRLLTRDCEVFSNDMRVLIHQTGLHTYPDVVVVCGQPVMQDQHRDVLTNPLILIEVLSESTKDYDRGGKFHQYKSIPSLKEYLTVSQTEMLVDHSVHQPDGGWLTHEIGPQNPSIYLTSLEVQLELADIYRKVSLAASLQALN